MHERIQFREKTKYGRVTARIPADLEQACRHLAHDEGWELGDPYRSLTMVGACGSFLMLRPRKLPKPPLRSDFPNVLKQYLGRRVYAPRTGKRSSLMTVCLPERVAYLLSEYSNLCGRLRSHTYARLLRAGLIVYLTAEHALANKLRPTNAATSVRPNRDWR